jgi:CHC2-type zinc finger protein
MPEPIEIDSQTTADAAAGQGRAKRGRLRRTLDGTHSSDGENLSTPRSTDYAQVNRVSLAMVLSHYGVLNHLKRCGAQLTGCCPIHDGSNPKQFVVHLASNNWHCFGDCSHGGGTLDFVAARERVPVARAAQLVAEWFALSPRPTRPQPQRTKSMNTEPSHRAYVVEDADGDQPEQKGFWTRIGSAWPHKDGKGLNIVLAALPVGGRIVLREYTAEDKAADAKRANRNK